MSKKKTSSTGFPKELITVTPLSKTLSFIAFITIPIIAFFFGIQYQQAIAPTSENIVPSYVQNIHVSPSPVTNR